MLPLAFPFERGGFRHELERREGEVCLVRRVNLETGSLYWEVVRLKRQVERAFAGRVYPARERYPTDAEWGSAGWTFTDDALARARMAELCKRGDRTRAQAAG